MPAQPLLVYTETQQHELLLRGLPWRATAPEVVLFLLSHGFQAHENDVQLCGDRRRRFNGRCVVRCRTANDAITAACNVHGKHWGNRYIEAFTRSQGVRTWCSAPSGDTQFGPVGKTPQIPP
jgi:hypothetical protein